MKFLVIIFGVILVASYAGAQGPNSVVFLKYLHIQVIRKYLHDFLSCSMYLKTLFLQDMTYT